MVELIVWNSEPFIEATRVGRTSTFYTNGVSATYDVTDTPMSEVGSTIEYGPVQKRLNNGGFTKDDGDETITINEVPAAGLQGVIPATRALIFDSYDTDEVSGVSDPRICVTKAFIGNIDDIANFSFVPKIGSTGIEIFIQDNITSIGPEESWYQIAACNASGTAGTYSATGVGLEMIAISASTTLAASGASGSWTIEVNSTGVDETDCFSEADYIIINPGQPSAEIVRIVDITDTTFTLKSGLSSDHDADEGVFVCVREYAIKQTVPEGAADGEASTYWNPTLEIAADSIQRD